MHDKRMGFASLATRRHNDIRVALLSSSRRTFARSYRLKSVSIFNMVRLHAITHQVCAYQPILRLQSSITEYRTRHHFSTQNLLVTAYQLRLPSTDVFVTSVGSCGDATHNAHTHFQRQLVDKTHISNTHSLRPAIVWFVGGMGWICYQCRGCASKGLNRA